MIKVITYGTFDMFHNGHIKLLERAKALGDYLIVGVTADDFDKKRGKINVKQSLIERIESVRCSGFADEIIVEEYEGQKIDDIKRLNVNIFTVGSDWIGKFDYLKEYCDVIYLPRTKGISSTDIREKERKLRLGLCGDGNAYLSRYVNESKYINGLEISGLYTQHPENLNKTLNGIGFITDNFNELLKYVDAVYLYTTPKERYKQIKSALSNGIHVLAEAPVTENTEQYIELSKMANENKLILVDALRTAYSTAYCRLLLLLKSGMIGKIVSVDSVCTSLKDFESDSKKKFSNSWNSMEEWGPTAMLPIFQILGTNYISKQIISAYADSNRSYDLFTKIEFLYHDAVGSVKVGKGVKSEGELIISGTRGYIYVPAPWWKTDYFEVRFENFEQNKRYFYQLDGEGIRYELVDFVKAIETGKNSYYISDDATKEIIKVYCDFCCKKDTKIINI